MDITDEGGTGNFLRRASPEFCQARVGEYDHAVLDDGYAVECAFARMPVTLVVGSLAGGMTFEEVQREFDLTVEDIRAALKFVGELADQESFHSLAA